MVKKGIIYMHGVTMDRDLLIRAIYETGGNIVQSALIMNVTAESIHLIKRNEPEFKELIMDARRRRSDKLDDLDHEIVDAAYMTLKEKILAGDVQACIFALRCKAKWRPEPSVDQVLQIPSTQYIERKID